jgi:polyisoprenoid-binding protein YceI
VSKRVAKKGADSFDVVGDLTIRGTTKEVTLPVTFLGKAKDPWGQNKVGFETETSVNRKDYGLNWNAALETGGLLVGDEVKINLSIQAIAQ